MSHPLRTVSRHANSGRERAVAALAAKQHSALGRRQAASIGLSQEAIASRLRKGVLTEPVSGVLVVAAAPVTWRQRPIIPTLIRPGGVVASHRAAAALHGFDGFPEEIVEITVEARRHPQMDGVVMHRDGMCDERDHTEVDGIPSTNIARTLCDLGAVASPKRVEGALDDALREGVSERWIRETLDRVDRPGPSGTAVLRRILALPDRAGALPANMFERLVDRVCVSGGLPPPVRQLEVHERGGSRVARLDLAWPDAMLAVQATSLRWHGAPSRSRRDKERDMWLKRDRWAIEYPTWEEAQAPDEFVAMLEAVYRSRVGMRSA